MSTFSVIFLCSSLIAFGAGTTLRSNIPMSSPSVVAKYGEGSFIVSLRKDNKHFCAGALILPRWVVTAANCLFHSSFEVGAGLQSPKPESASQIRHIVSEEYYLRHENFNPNTDADDIGIIYIEEPFQLVALGNPAPVSLISLPSHQQIGEGRLFGWHLIDSADFTNELQVLDVKITNNTECQGSMSAQAPLLKKQSCAYKNETVDTVCPTEGGNSIVQYTRYGPVLVGFESWASVSCKNKANAAVFTQISDYRIWIIESILNFGLKK